MKKPRNPSFDDAPKGPDIVGYRRPPIHSRFKPGESGNPKGRPKVRKPMGDIFDEALNERISIRAGDKIRRVSRKEAMVLALIQRGMKGDPRAIAAIMALAQQRGEFKKPFPYSAIERIIVDPKDPSGSSSPLD
jgi:hypothetical protein